MPLVACPECDSSVSDAAPSCPHCGHPFQQSGLKAQRLNPRHTGQVVAIEKTGKGLKLQKAIATLMLIFGVVMTIIAANQKPTPEGAMTIGVLSIVLSIPWLIYIRIASWWRHG